MNFDEIWSAAALGETVAVSNGKPEPQDELGARAWRSLNFSGELLAKVDGPPRRLRIKWDDAPARLVAFEVGEHQAVAFARVAHLASVQDARLIELAARRWAAQTSFAYDGVAPVAFGADTAGNLVAVMQLLAAAGPGATTTWKLGRGAHRVWTLAELQAFAGALHGYMAACFARESELAAAILAAADVAAVNALDIDSDWPDPEGGGA